MDPLFWLVLSFLLVAVSLTAVLLVMVPAVRELSRAARSVEKLCDTLSRELPPTLESIRLTSLEITELTDDVTEGVQNASHIVQQVDHSLSTVRQQTERVQAVTRSMMAGMRAAWRTLRGNAPRDRRRLPTPSSPACPARRAAATPPALPNGRREALPPLRTPEREANPETAAFSERSPRSPDNPDPDHDGSAS